MRSVRAVDVVSEHGSIVLTADLDTATNTWQQTAIYDKRWIEAVRRMATQLNSLRAVVQRLRVTTSPDLMSIEYQAAGSPSCSPLPNGSWKCCWKPEGGQADFGG